MNDYTLSLTINILNQLLRTKYKNIFDNIFIPLKDSIHRATIDVSNFTQANKRDNTNKKIIKNEYPIQTSQNNEHNPHISNKEILHLMEKLAIRQLPILSIQKR